MDRIFKKLNRYFYGKWRPAVLDLKAGRRIKEPEISNIPYLKAQNADGRHILIQPAPDVECYCLLVDDADWPVILRQHHYPDGTWKPGRMVAETSPGNYQVWIHSAGALPLEEKRHWLRKLHSDPGADPNNRWGRCPGFRNRKEKYRDAEGRYPLAKLVWIDWKELAQIPDPFSHLPRGVYQYSNLSRSDCLRGDESVTDFSYAVALMRRGYSNDEVEACLRRERTNWKNHSGERRMQHCLDRTVRRARNVVEEQAASVCPCG